MDNSKEIIETIKNSSNKMIQEDQSNFSNFLRSRAPSKPGLYKL